MKESKPVLVINADQREKFIAQNGGLFFFTGKNSYIKGETALVRYIVVQDKEDDRAIPVDLEVDVTETGTLPLDDVTDEFARQEFDTECQTAYEFRESMKDIAGLTADLRHDPSLRLTDDSPITYVRFVNPRPVHKHLMAGFPLCVN